jgi:Tol biopolymer transport system component
MRRTASLFIIILAAMAAALAASILIVALIAASSKPAQAAFPGTNGKIAFVRTLAAGNEEIYTMNPDGTSQQNLTRSSANDSFPAYSADGENIAFSSDRDGNGEIYRMTRTGTLQTRLTDNPAADRRPSWQPRP